MGTIPVAMEPRLTIDNRDLMELLSFCSAKEKNQVERKFKEWERIFATYTADRELISGIHKELEKQSKNNNKQLNKKIVNLTDYPR